MTVLLTGCAGFVGSHTVEALTSAGENVIGIDCLRPFYDTRQKEHNLKTIAHPRFRFINGDLSEMDLSIVKECDRVIHLAGQAGVGPSWSDFPQYLKDNVLATHRLLNASVHVKKFVYASSSSVYGDVPVPYNEEGPTNPISPYGITKLSAELLCRAFPLPVVALRYFTVYGPRQRPDMAFRIFIDAIRSKKEIQLLGGDQTRDFTYISDIVNANLAALRDGSTGVFNIGGGSRLPLTEVIHTLGSLLGETPHTVLRDRRRGDVVHTHADLTRATRMLGYVPKVSLREGLQKEIEWVISYENDTR